VQREICVCVCVCVCDEILILFAHKCGRRLRLWLSTSLRSTGGGREGKKGTTDARKLRISSSCLLGKLQFNLDHYELHYSFPEAEFPCARVDGKMLLRRSARRARNEKIPRLPLRRN